MKNTQITAVLADGTEKTLTVTDMNVIRQKELNLVKEVVFKLDGDDEFLHITTNNGRAVITLYERSDIPAFRNRLMQFNIMSITANNVTFKPHSGLAALNTFTKSFNQSQEIQKEFLKSNGRLAGITFNRDGSFKLIDKSGQRVLCKTTEVFVPAFMQQLEKLGYDVKRFTSEQLSKLSTTLIEFVNANTTTKQKSLFNSFVNYISK